MRTHTPRTINKKNKKNPFTFQLCGPHGIDTWHTPFAPLHKLYIYIYIKPITKLTPTFFLPNKGKFQ